MSGLSLGDAVKFHGVDVGTVKTLAIDNADPSLVQVDVSLRKDTPVKTDTKASLKLKGITGTLFVELNGAGVDAKNLVEATPAGQIPEIPSEKSKLTTLLDALPNVIEKFSSMETKASKMITDVGKVTGTMKEAAENAKKGLPPPERVFEKVNGGSELVDADENVGKDSNRLPQRRQDPCLVRRGERPPLRPGRLSPGHLTIMPGDRGLVRECHRHVSVVPSRPALPQKSSYVPCLTRV